ncbi:rhamnosyltransferase [Aeromonas caviae]|uniref:glycosyltransferase family 2 protein n=1 Tax=Aeromonas caviae TaxID=648 RepID=UPI000ABF97B2|nr:glycosyltransferase family 2 protein [Aeromonas caviae]NBA24204.1 rhamnosyltransferase [Aeromonas caviae]
MIYAVIVTYNPEEEKLKSLISSLMSSGVYPVVVDNASSLLCALPCKVIQLDSNYGIAKAQNIGVDYILSVDTNASAVVFFDQDSSISDDVFISKLYEPILNNRTKISAPVFIDQACGFTYPIVEIKKLGNRVKHYPSPDAAEFNVNCVISSGTMVEVSALKKIGFMIEGLFIDYVDTEWCLRAYSMGFDILIVPSARMKHSIGDKTIKFGSFYIPKHSPTRRYYRIRNAFYLLRMSHVPKIMSCREIIFSIMHQTILISLSKSERRAYLNSLLRGVRDGLMGCVK